MDIKRLQELAGIKVEPVSTKSELLTEAGWFDSLSKLGRKQVDSDFAKANKALKIFEEVRIAFMNEIVPFYNKLFFDARSPLKGDTEYKAELDFFNDEVGKVFGLTYKDGDAKAKITLRDSGLHKFKKFIHGVASSGRGAMMKEDVIVEQKIVTSTKFQQTLQKAKKDYKEGAQILYDLEKSFLENIESDKSNYHMNDKKDQMELNDVYGKLAKIINFFQNFEPFIENLQIPESGD